MFIKLNACVFNGQPVKIGLPTHRGQHFVDHHRLLPGTNADTTLFLLQFGCMPKPEGKGAGHHFNCALPGTRISKPGDVLLLINAGHRYSKLCKCLAQFQADDAKTDNRDRLRQIFLLKQGIAGEDAIPKIHPGGGNHRTSTAGNDDALGLNNVVSCLQNARRNKTRVAV